MIEFKKEKMQISERKTNQDVLNKIACSSCLHDVSEHDGKCFALDFDGNTYFTCKCSQLKSEFKILLKVPALDQNQNGMVSKN